MRRVVLLAATIMITAAPMAVAAAPQFLAYEGRDAVHDGRGGSKKIVDGVDFWLEGDPPHHYQVLGVLTDKRHETGIYGMIRMSGLDSDIAKAAKAAGGDAVIMTNEGEDVTGYATSSGAYVSGNGYSANGTGWGLGRAIKDHLARYVVVKYLPDPAPAAPVSPSQP